MSHQEEGMVVLNKFTAGLNDLALIEVPAKKEGKQVFVLFAPDPIKIKEFIKKGGSEKPVPPGANEAPEAEDNEES
jgi:hypothetical protein